MSVVRFRLDGPPPAWHRPANRRGGGRRTEDVDRAAKERIVLAARREARGVTFPTGPVRLDIVAVYPRPDRRPPWCPAEAWATGARVYAVPATDRSNVEKLIEDALGTDRTRAWKLWSDDNQVAAGETRQVYAAVGEGPCVEVAVQGLDAAGGGA